nr:MAG TPA: Forkhead box M1 factor, Cell cycle, negative [Caudoviricetes sp.]
MNYLGRDIVNQYLELFYDEYKRVHHEINRFNTNFDPANDCWSKILLDIFAIV